jgi:hypothetical protein
MRDRGFACSLSSRASLILMRISLRWIRGHRGSTAKPLQGEEFEIAKAEEDAQKERDRYTARLFRNVGNLRYPFLKDPFD